MDDFEDDSNERGPEYEVLEPAPFSGWSAAGHIALAAAGIAECLSDCFANLAKDFGHAANHRFYQWKAKDEGERFAADVLQSIGGLDELG